MDIEKYGDEGFVILDFPCNQFGNQAPGSDESPLYTYLKSQKGFAGFAPEHPLTPMLESMLERADANYAESSDIKWNFTKYLIDRQGNVITNISFTV